MSKKVKGIKRKKILIIDYNFLKPKNTGSFRWMCFVKHFAREKNKVHIITVDWKIESRQSLENDLKSKNIIFHKIPSYYLHNLKYREFPNSFFGLFLKKLINLLIKIFSLIYFVDEAQYWGYSLIPYCKNLIEKEKIKYVIATGGPFMTNYWAARVKKELPKIKLIQDFRAEWNNAGRFLFPFFRKLSLKYKSFSLNNCDAVVTTSDSLNEHFAIKIDNKNTENYVIHNGFDKIGITPSDDMDREFSFLYAGSLANEKDKVLHVFLDIVDENVQKFKEIKIYIYSKDHKKVIKKYTSLINSGNLIVNDFIPQKQLFKEIDKSFIALHLIPDSHKSEISIKLFEYAFFKRPILLLNSGGIDSELIMMKHNLGISRNYLNEKVGIKNVILDYYYVWRRNPKASINPIGVEKYSFDNLSREYLRILDELK